MPVCVLVLIGLPGCGKSTLGRYMKENCASGWNFHLVSFDKEIVWVDNLLWKEERRKVMVQVEEVVGGLKESTEINVVVLDDNMYYRSMRYEYFQLASKLSAGFCEVFLNIRMDVAISRNALRAQCDRVPQEIIERMASKIEPPNPDSYNWEKLNLQILEDDSSATSLNFIQDLVKEALMNLPKIEGPRQKASVEPTLLHQADVALRKITADLIKTSKDPSHISTILDKRREILQKFRSGSLPVTTEAQILKTYFV